MSKTEAIKAYTKKCNMSETEVTERLEDDELLIFDTAEDLFEWMLDGHDTVDALRDIALNFFHSRFTLDESQSVGEAYLLEDEKVCCVGGYWFFNY